MLHETLCHVAAGISIIGLDDGVIFTLFFFLIVFYIILGIVTECPIGIIFVLY